MIAGRAITNLKIPAKFGAKTRDGSLSPKSLTKQSIVFTELRK